MNILLINIDSKRMPNLVLKKIEKYHADLGDEVIWDMPLYAHLADKIYVSCVFERNKNICIREWGNPDINMFDFNEGYFIYKEKVKILIGGSGFDLKIKLPEEIEKIKPHINLGFTTRGCIRHCKFCIVSEKEGKIRAVGDLLDLWDGKSKEVILFDNNILALPEHFKLICQQARENNIRIDFNQGLDCRLLNQGIVNELKNIKTFDLHFAFDDLSYFDDVDKAITLLQKNGIKRCNWLMLTGFNTTLKEDLFRAEYLRSRDQIAYVMRYNNSKRKDLIPLSRWVNNRAWFRAITYKEFLKRNYKKELSSGVIK